MYNDMLYRILTTHEIRNPLRTFISDKEHLKQYVKATLGDSFNVRTFAVLKSPEEVDNYTFLNACVAKPTHGCGQVLIIEEPFNHFIDRKLIKSWFHFNIYDNCRQENYKNLLPKIMIEELLPLSHGMDEYKVFCIHGQPRAIIHSRGFKETTKVRFYDRQWNTLDIKLLPSNDPLPPSPAPNNLEAMIDAASILSAPFDFIRVDLYSDGERCLVSELTNCSAGASRRFASGHEEVLSRLLFKTDK
ncbi:ATP-grasp fold amidoligase family protein [Pseudazoarcus pumilus]|nr:ATP-grasp fold amidoligase family protein [Pseudazoarcus pumilus]